MGKTHFAFGLIFGVLISLTSSYLFDQSKYGDKAIIRQKNAEIARLKLENEVMKADTANWIAEHSELKGD